MLTTAAPQVAAPPPPLDGSASFVDVIPYDNGQPLMVDGNQSAVRFVFETPQIFLPVAIH